MKVAKYIVSDENVLSGKSVIKGTRIPVSRIVFLLGDGYTPEAIHMEYPHVSLATIQGTISELGQQLDKCNASQNISA